MKKEIKIDDNLIIAEFFGNINQIFIPKKLSKAINHIHEKDLLTINKDINVAKELCLYFTSFLIPTMFPGEYEFGKALNGEMLGHLLRSPKRDSIDKYTAINTKKVLLKGTEKYAIIKEESKHSAGHHSKKYNLTDSFKCGVDKYTLKTKYVKDIVLRNYREKLTKAYSNDIAINMIKTYSYIDLPTKEELIIKAKELIKEGYTTKKGKLLTFQYRQKITHWKDAGNRAFVERDIEMFEYYTSNGFIIPVVGNENCPRVYDSLSLLPSWIRNEIKYKGKQLKELDYKCLHPNLIMNIYKGNTKFITHEKVAKDLMIEKSDVKKAHLSFFNLDLNSFTHTDLFKYYNKIEPKIIDNVIEDKKTHGHKITSKLLFTLEVELMTNVIKKLNNIKIYPIYIYDALMVSESDYNVVNKIMNETALEMNIYTNTGEETIETIETKQEENKGIKLNNHCIDYTNEELYEDLKTRFINKNEEFKLNIYDIKHEKDRFMHIKDLYIYLYEQNEIRIYQASKQRKVIKIEKV